MSIVAILSDIHGNLPALQAIKNDMKAFDIEHYCVLGDLVGYYYQPKAVLDWVRSLKNATVIQGNHERMLFAARNDAETLEKITRKYGSGIKIALQDYTQEDMDYLNILPDKTTITINNKTILCCHGSPMNGDQYIYPNSPASLLAEVAASAHNAHADYVAMGHTHHPMIAQVNGITLLNSGSVGQPRDVGGMASYMLLHTNTGVVQPRRVPYDSAPLIADALQHDPHLPYLQHIQRRGNPTQEEAL